MRTKARSRLAVLIFLFVGLSGIGLVLNSGHAHDCPEMDKEVTFERTFLMEKPEGVTASQPPVTFSHLGHAMEYGCGACHHKWEPENEAEPAKCFDCHSNIEERTGEDSYFGAFHNRQSEIGCLGCHVSVNKENETLEAPIRCNECHIRDKESS